MCANVLTLWSKETTTENPQSVESLLSLCYCFNFTMLTFYTKLISVLHWRKQNKRKIQNKINKYTMEYATGR